MGASGQAGKRRSQHECDHIRNALPKIVAAYGLSEPSFVLPLALGRTVTCLLLAGVDSFVLRAAPAWLRALDDVRTEVAVMRLLHSKGAYVPTPVARSDGGAVTRLCIDGSTWWMALCSYVAGRRAEPTPRECRRIGEGLASLHVCADGYAGSTRVRTLGAAGLSTRPARYVSHLVADDPNSLCVLRGVTKDLAGMLHEYEARLPTPSLCHGDAHHRNVCVDQLGAVWFLDFEHASVCWRVYDLATCIWGRLGSAGATRLWNAIVDGYDSVRSLSRAETDAIPVFVAARHLWWMGFRARYWSMRWRPRLNVQFLADNILLLRRLVDVGSGARFS